jgi:2-polyprenyl-3-methyl-5-hydroxy-6-metoxy-1,4-benzoquinol methylase
MSMNARVDQPELMDLGDFGPTEYRRTLVELELINRLTDGYKPTLRAIARLASRTDRRPLRILDVGFGYGDTLRAIAAWATKENLEVELLGIDLNPEAKEIAAAATPTGQKISYNTGDAFEFDSGEVDIVINSLFMHHLSDRQIPQFLAWMTKRARVGWFINDLHRHPVAYQFIKYVSRALGFTRMIRHDAPLSVARSFRRRDWEGYLAEAHVPRSSVSIHWHWSFRICVLFEASQS